MSRDDIFVAMLGGIWATPGVSLEPEIVLIRWRVLEIRNAASEMERHLVGYSWSGHEGRVSSAIVAFDPFSRIAVTRSGRVYNLYGPPGVDLDGDYVWRYWSHVKKYTDERDVTGEYIGKISEADATNPEEPT